MRVSKVWNKNGNCALVVGATAPAELEHVRQIVGNMELLIPGIGKQGGSLEEVVKAGADNNGTGMIINSSSGIIFASAGEDFAEAAGREAKKLNDEINALLARRVA
jgi:orotidine-5'-phosphate decarboxylase